MWAGWIPRPICNRPARYNPAPRRVGAIIVGVVVETPADQTLFKRLRSATDLLESIASNRAILEQAPDADRKRFHRAIAEVYNPDPIARRRRVKAAERARTAARTEHAD